MKINRIHSLTLKGVKLRPISCDCFMHDISFLGINLDDLTESFEGQHMIIYNGDFSSKPRFFVCPWCKVKINNNYEEHILDEHNKKISDLKMYKFQIELYREKLKLYRAGEVNHTYFCYMNKQCQFCDDERKRGRGLCSISESARNKTRSLINFGFTASNFPNSFLEKDNIGYLIGDAKRR